MSRDVALYLDDRIEACRRVLDYTGSLTRDTFSSGTMGHDAVLRNLEILGEAEMWRLYYEVCVEDPCAVSAG